MRPKKLICLMLFLGAFAALCLLHASAECRTATFYVDGIAVQTQQTDEGGAMALPSAPATGEKLFLGWVYQTGENEVLYPANSSFRETEGSGELIFRALTAELRTLTGAAVSLCEPYSLRFDGTVALADYNRIAALVGEENLSFGLLTAPFSKIIGQGTNFNLTDGAEFITPVPANAAMTGSTQILFSARISGIAAEEMLSKYTARAYLTICYPNGAESTFYAPYSRTDHARAVHAVLAAAYEDFSQESDHKYANAFLSGETKLYSPYTTEERLYFVHGLNRVISIATPMEPGDLAHIEHTYSMDGIHFREFRFYASPYEVSAAVTDDKALTITVVGKSNADFHNIATYYIGGSYDPYFYGKCRYGDTGFIVVQSIDTIVH